MVSDPSAIGTTEPSMMYESMRSTANQRFVTPDNPITEKATKISSQGKKDAIAVPAKMTKAVTTKSQLK